MKNLLVVTLLMTVICGCSGGQEPQVTYKGIDAVAAVDLLNQSSSDQEFANAIIHISENRRQGFDWSIFWDGILKNKVMHKHTSERRDKIVLLSKLECSFSAFNSYVAAINNFVEYDDTILSGARYCEQEFSEENFKILFKRLSNRAIREKDEVAARHFTFLISEFQPDIGLIRSLVNSITEVEWVEIGEHWLTLDDSTIVRRFITSFRNLYGSSQVLETLSVKSFNSSIDLGETFKHLGLVRGLDLLIHAIGNNPDLVRVPLDQWIRQTGSLIALYQSTSKDESTGSQEKLLEDFRSFERFVTFLSLSVGSIQGNEIVSMLSKITDIFEKKVNTAENAKFLIDTLPGSDLLSSVLIRKFQHSIGSAYFESNIGVLNQDNSLLMKLISTRNQIYLAKSDEQGRKLTNTYCQKISEIGQINQSIDFADLNATSALFPGCVTLVGDESPESTFNYQGDFVFSPYNLLITQGASLKFSAPIFIGSMIDATNFYQHPELPVEPPLKEDHAISFPVPVGFRLSKDPVGGLEVGTHYLFFHYTHRFALDGRPSQVTPKKGYPGGSVEVKVDSKDSWIAPALVSLGGVGQKGAPRRKGGNSSFSKISWQKFSNALALTNPQNTFAEESRYFRPQPTIHLLQRILDNADLNDDGGIRLFYLTKIWWEILDDDQREKVHSVCGGVGLDEACAKEISFKAAMQMVNELESIQGLQVSDNASLDRLKSVTYVEPEGELGPFNPDGSRGDSGELVWEVRSEN